MPLQTERRTNERVQLRGAYDVTLRRHDDVPPTLPDDHLLVRCHYSLISPGSELSFYTGSHGGFANRLRSKDPYFPGFQYPITPGYAAVGVVEAVGARVDRFVPGALVYYPGKHQRFSVISPETTPVLHVPSGVPLHRVPFTRLGQIAGTALAFTDAGEGDTVAVLGLGLIGNLAAQLLRIRGASIIGAELVGFRRDLAMRAGIDHLIDAASVDVVEATLVATDGAGVRTVIEATGNPTLVDTALRMVAKRGDVVLLGSPLTASSPDDALTAYILHLIHRKGARVIGAHESLIPQIGTSGEELDQQQLARAALDAIVDGRLVVEHLVSDIVKPGGIEGAYRSLLDEKDSTMTMLVDWTDQGHIHAPDSHQADIESLPVEAIESRSQPIPMGGRPA